METNRVEAFSDGVFAIAITLLILIVELPSTDRSLGDELVRLWPTYLAYAVSFLTIGIIWVNHHNVFRQIGHVDRTFLFLNIFFLMSVAFIPFPRRVVAEHTRSADERQAAALIYGISMTAMSVLFLSLWLYASVGRRLLRADAEPREVDGITRSFVPGTPTYAGATLLALASPIASLVIFALLAVFYMLCSTLFGRG